MVQEAKGQKNEGKKSLTNQSGHKKENAKSTSDVNHFYSKPYRFMDIQQTFRHCLGLRTV